MGGSASKGVPTLSNSESIIDVEGGSRVVRVSRIACTERTVSEVKDLKSELSVLTKESLV